MNKYRKNLVLVLARIQNCWSHDDDGSDLIKSRSSRLFSLVFNDLRFAIIGDEDSCYNCIGDRDGKNDNEVEEIKNLLERDYSFTKIVEEVEQAEKEKTDAQSKEIEALKKKIRGLEGSIEHWYKPYERDARAYLKLLEKNEICPTCGAVDKVCDCPFG